MSDDHRSMRRFGVRVVLAITACVLAAAAPPASGAPLATKIALSPQSGPPTTQFHCDGSGFNVGEVVDILWDGQQIDTTQANAGGKFFVIETVPAAAVPGTHIVEAKGETSGRSARATFKVTTNWLQLGFDALRTSLNPYENVLDPQNVSGIVINWSTRAGGPIRSSPVYYSGKLYVGSDDGWFYKADPTTGEVIAIIKTGGPIVTSPAVIKGFNPQPDPPGKVVFASTDGNLYVVSTKTDAKLWSKAIGDPHLSSPLVTPGPDARSMKIVVGTSRGKLLAFDATGRRLWVTKWSKTQQLTPSAYD